MLNSAVNRCVSSYCARIDFVEVVQTELGDEADMRQVEERRHAAVTLGAAAGRVPDRPQQHIDRLRVVVRQVSAQHPRDVAAAVHQLEGARSRRPRRGRNARAERPANTFE